MKRFTKITALLLCLLMLCSLFAGCGNNNEYGEIEIASPEELDPAKIGDYSTLKLPLDTKGTTIRALVNTDVTTNNDSVFVKELRRRTGLNVQIVAVPISAYKEKLKIIIASQDEMPDMMSSSGLSTDDINDFGNQGAFAEVLHYQDKLPNFKKIYVDEAEERGVAGNLKNIMSADGNLYYFPVYDISRDVNHGMLYRKDIFDKHGIKLWNDKESFLNVLRQLKKLYPNSIPFASKTGSGIFRDLGYSWGLNYFAPYYDEETDKWKYSCADPKFKELIDFIKTMYQEGLIDPEFLTCTQAAWTQKMTQREKSFVTWDWIGRLDMFQEQSTIPGYNLRYGNPVGPKQTLVTLEQVSLGGVCVTNNKVSDLSIKVMDFLYSDAGAELMTCGVRGETFEIDETTGMAKYLDPELQAKEKVDIMDLRSKYCMWMSGAYRRVDPRSCYFQFTEREQEAQDWVEKCGGLEPSDPVVTFVGDTATKASDIVGRLSKKFEEVMFKYIVGTETGDAAWDKWLKEAKKLGEDELCKIYNNRHKELGL